MYKCKNCGNTEKFIGFAEEKGYVFIFLDNPDNSFCIKEIADSPGIPEAYNEIPLTIKINGTFFKEMTSKNISWFYCVSDDSWMCSIKIKKCFYCLSEDISSF